MAHSASHASERRSVSSRQNGALFMRHFITSDRSGLRDGRWKIERCHPGVQASFSFPFFFLNATVCTHLGLQWFCLLFHDFVHVCAVTIDTCSLMLFTLFQIRTHGKHQFGSTRSTSRSKRAGRLEHSAQYARRTHMDGRQRGR